MSIVPQVTQEPCLNGTILDSKKENTTRPKDQDGDDSDDMQKVPSRLVHKIRKTLRRNNDDAK